MDFNEQWAAVLAAIAVLVGVAEVYARTFGPTQARLNEAVIQAASVPSQWKPALNYGLSILVAAGGTVVIASAVGAWQIIPASVVVGALAAGVAADVHDTGKIIDAAITSQTTEMNTSGNGANTLRRQ